MKVGFSVHPFNLAMREARTERGLTQRALAEMCGTHAQFISQIETLQYISLNPARVQQVFRAIALSLDAEIETLFPPDYIAALEKKLLPRRSSGWLLVREVDIEQLSAIDAPPLLMSGIENEAIAELSRDDLKDELRRVLDTLTDRERETIEMRFGINSDGCGMTLAEVGRKFNTTRERIRQIEANALRKLRHRVPLCEVNSQGEGGKT